MVAEMRLQRTSLVAAFVWTSAALLSDQAEATVYRGNVAIAPFNSPANIEPFTNIENSGNPLETLLTGQFAPFNNEAIEYFIPLDSPTAPATFGSNGAGQSADQGAGSPENAVQASLEMFIIFDDLVLGEEYQLDIFFEDLDLIGTTNAPYGTAAQNGFREAVNVFQVGGANNGTQLLSGTPQAGGDNLFTDVAQSIEITGSPNAGQQISIDLGVIDATQVIQGGAYAGLFAIRLEFGVTVEDNFSGNSSEFLAAFVSNDLVVPLPATAWLLLGGIGALGFVRRRQRA
ncbi:MAG: VPLPA-CTERM sorting domain-containing protein [Pseudomonadota bacterium]